MVEMTECFFPKINPKTFYQLTQYSLRFFHLFGMLSVNKQRFRGFHRKGFLGSLTGTTPTRRRSQNVSVDNIVGKCTEKL